MVRKQNSAMPGRQAGSALLIAVFALLLISVIGIALLVSTGTDSALAGNYRSSTSAYYAAVAGLEEGRGRLLRKNPDYINKANAYPTLFSAQGLPTFSATDVLYIINPANGETVDPTNSTNPYYDREYGVEFSSWGLSGATMHTPVLSTSPMAGIPGPAYKWVRINAITEAALGLDIDSSGHPLDAYTPLFYNGNGMNLTSTGSEALEITAFAVMPDKSKKLLQYVVYPSTLNLNFPAALTLAGNGVSYQGPNSTSFSVSGNDPTTGRTCINPPPTQVYAIGHTNSADQSRVLSGTNYRPGNYIGISPPTPSVNAVPPLVNLQMPSQYESLIQTITEGADVVIQGPTYATSSMPAGMSATNPMTIVVNGDIDFAFWHNTGYGLLLVTGNLNYDPDASWEGVVLVVGRGVVTGVTGSGLGSGRINGAMLVAETRDQVTGAALTDPNLGAASVSFNAGMGGYGIYFNSCSILQAMAPLSFKVLTFREMLQ